MCNQPPQQERERLLGCRLLDVAQYDRLAETPSSAD
jgi:hypothetical protein